MLVSDADRAEGMKLGRHPDLAGEILRDVEKLGLVGEENNKLMGYLVMTSRKMDDPLALLILSGSGAGKSLLQDTLLKLCPDEDLVKLTSLTDRALFYKGEDALQKQSAGAWRKWPGPRGAYYAIRNLISRQKTGHRIHHQKSADRHADHAGQHGAWPDGGVSDDDAARHGRRDAQPVHHHQRGRIAGADAKPFWRRNATATRWTDCAGKNCAKPSSSGITPFNGCLKPRAGGQSVRAVAVVCRGPAGRAPRQSQIPESHFSRDVSAPDAAPGEARRRGWATTSKRRWVTSPSPTNWPPTLFGQTLDELSRPSRELLKLIRQMVDGLGKADRQHGAKIMAGGAATFNRRAVRELTGWSDYQIKIHIKQLEDLEYLVPISGRRGQSFCYRLAWEGEGLDGERFLPGLIPVEELRRKAQVVGLFAEQVGSKTEVVGPRKRSWRGQVGRKLGRAKMEKRPVNKGPNRLPGQSWRVLSAVRTLTGAPTCASGVGVPVAVTVTCWVSVWVARVILISAFPPALTKTALLLVDWNVGATARTW